jgi:glycosyltransferase involved in cell wall biosynthesis
VSIFQNYYDEKQQFMDRYETEPEKGIDVIIPIIHTNEIWEKNLLSFYREIPIHRLLIGDGGCIDGSIKTVKKFPRVKVFDHRKITSLGFSIRKLIESVETEWFVYLHSDVYLPPGWFNAMQAYQDKYDWFECRQKITALVEYDLDYTGINRALSGSQMGRRKVFEEVLPKIEDDYLYRTEDIILSELIKKNGKKYGRVDDVFHYHQVMFKQSRWHRKVKNLNIELELGRDEEVRSCMTMAKGIVKYLEPPKFVSLVISNVNRLQELGKLDWATFDQWVREINPSWLPFLHEQRSSRALAKKAFRLLKQNWNKIKKLLQK